MRASATRRICSARGRGRTRVLVTVLNLLALLALLALSTGTAFAQSAQLAAPAPTANVPTTNAPTGNVPTANATMRTPEILRADPTPTAAGVGNLAVDDRVQVVERKGFWAKVATRNTTGWVKISTLALDAPPNAGTAPANAGAPLLTALVTGRTGSGNIVNTAGTRGLSAEDIRAAQPDMNAVTQVKALAATPAAATQYAQQGGLQTRQLPYLTPTGAPRP